MWTKSAARMPRACEVRNCFQVGPLRRGAGCIPALCRICHTVDAAMGWPSQQVRLGHVGVPTSGCRWRCGSRASGWRLPSVVVRDAAGWCSPICG